MNPLMIAPSILSANPAQLGQALIDLTQAKADCIHIDVMDGHFVPNLTFGPPVIKALRPYTTLDFDVHLMIEKPELSIQQYAEAGADYITVHAEACTHLHRTLQQIKSFKSTQTQKTIKAGVSLNPHSPIELIEYVLEEVDLVLIMTVNPGFGGQKFIQAVCPKIEKLKALRTQKGLKFDIEIDGGINKDTIVLAQQSGANIFVAGSAVIQNYQQNATDYQQNINTLRNALHIN
jgi:ribulose-phosphate 3-epimerase